MPKLSKITLLLTLGYFLLWVAGPLCIDPRLMWLGMPLWFWLSIIAAPACLVLALCLLRMKNVL
ncbi:hypothetical protein NFHSH190041_21740 [Shewanella sp. NFH-SH190041]|uniref:hypothetical protein n=1 Tax=Shewanella sp. NFH-SH190041 TaxID=2950245 RepID=UPI0021C3E71D|nr:hypothetical protein [Shewanella sp. NFH-SH190041]BDM64722.1 hypothetical protein NFHSH190041_21740 [Shewanella sp. NFH-SH190041]